MTAIPAAVDALLAATKRALPGVQVHDGQPVVSLANDCVVIGYDPDRAAADQTESSGGLVTDRDTFDIVGLVSSWAGDAEMRPRRVRVFEMYAALRAELAQDSALGGAVTHCRPSVAQLQQGRTRQENVWTGTWATVAFTVRCQAFLS